MAINYRGTSVARNLGMVAPVRTYGSVTAGNAAVFADATGRRIKDGGTAVRQQDFAAVADLPADPTLDDVIASLRSALAVLKGAAKIALAMLALGAGAQSVRLGSLRASDTVVTNEQDALAYPVATNALALAEGALQSEADTLATVTARGGTTTSAVTIGSRGVGAVGVSSFANGENVVASGSYSHAEGLDTTASGDHSHAEGGYTTAIGPYSHAEGMSTTASGDISHAEGLSTTASGYYSHASGYSTTASGDVSHASGFNAVASHISAFAWQGAASGQYAEPEYGSHGPGTYNINPVGGLAGLWIGETNMATTLSGYATTGAVAAVQAEVADPWIDWSATITPVNGTATVTRATGADPVLVLTDDVVISVPTTGWPTTGVSRVSLSLWAGSHSVTLLTNTVEYSSTPTISTNDWTTILFRRTGDQAKWKGVGL